MRTHRHVRWFRALSALISLMLLLTSLSSLTPTTLAVSTSHMPNPSTDNIRDDFDPTFSSPSYPVHTIQSPIDLSFPPNAGNWAPPVTTEITLPPGSYHQQLTADVTLSGDNIAVAKVALFSAGSDRWEEAVLAEKQGAGVVHHTGTVSLGFFAVPQETPLTLKLRCYKGSTDDTASCSFRNLRLTDAVPGWVELESAPTNLAHTTVGTHIGDIVADPQHGSFLGFTINSSGSRRATYRSPPLTFPTIKRTDVVTASVRWARHTKDSNPVYNASGAEIRFVTTTGRAAGLVSIPRLDIPTRDPIDMLEGWTNTTQTHSTRRLRGVSGETGSIEVMKWGGSTDHTFALDDLQLYINGEPVWTRADQPFLDLTVTDSASQSVEALALNSDGWPAINAATGAAANPITVTVTFDPSETERDFDTLRLWIGSEDTEQRFYTGFAGEQDVDCFPPGIIAHDSSQYSYEEYVLRCDLFYAVSPNVRTIQRQIWVQPSTATVLPITATLIDLESGTEVTARVDVDIPEAAIHPLVFLPGLGATIPPVYDSDPDDTLWIGDMIADYGTFYENLEKMGYERDVTYFRFPYDWLRSTIETSSHLWTKLDTWDNIAAQVPWVHSDGGDANTVTFDLVGHSTGNLVVRAYVQGPEWRSTRDNVRRWVSIAGPLQGVPKAYRGFEGLNPDLGKLEDGFPLLFAGLDAWIFQRAHQAGYTIPIDETNVTLTTQNKYLFVHDPENGLTILPEFLPTYGDYFFDGDNNPNPYGRLANPLLEDSSVVNGTLDDARNGTMEGKVFDPYLGNPHLFNTTIYEKPIPPGFQTTYRGLNTPAKMALLESRIGADNICVVYGGATENVTNPTDTPEGIRVSEPQTIAPYWLNGIRVRDIQTSGDGLITETSADLKNIWTVEVPSENTFEIENVLERQSDHTNIVGEQLSISATTQCLSQLKAPFLTKHYPRPGTTTAPKAPLPPAIASTPSSTAPIQSLLLYAPGPVDLLLTNAQGQRLGYDTDSGTILKEIPDAVYYQDNNEQAAYLFVYGADLGDYEVTVTGTAVGDYEVIGWYEDDTATVNLVYEEGTASLGSTAQIDLALPIDTRDVPTPPRVQTGPDFQVMVGEIARFTGYLSDINPQDTHTISWDFGDQNKVDGTLTPEHTYIATGQYTATLTITDSTNLVASDIVRVDVIGPPLAPLSFTEVVTYPFQSGPQTFLTVADGNNDGIVDIIGSDGEGPHPISLLTGRGDGTFGDHQYIDLTYIPGVAIADFDGDQQADMAIAGQNDFFILAGQGNGQWPSFDSNAPRYTSESFHALIVEDFNQDGWPDLATSNSVTNAIDVWYGNGDRTFQDAVSYPVGTLPLTLTSGDLNGDTLPDLIAANAGDNSVSVLFNTGNLFTTAFSYSVGTFPMMVTTADLNGDNVLDLVTANGQDDAISLLFNDGTGQFQDALPMLIRHPSRSITTGDLNGDGYTDILVGSQGTLEVLLSYNNGTFQSAGSYAIHGTVRTVAIADLDADGQQDMVALDMQQGEANVFLKR